MNNFLRNLLLGAALGLSLPSAMAQSESFTGISGNSYYVDYVSGLVMQLDGNDATIVSPAKVVETEFDPLMNGINEQDALLNNLSWVLEDDINYFENIYATAENLNAIYWDSTLSFTSIAYDMMAHYTYMLDFIQQIADQRGATKPAKAIASETQNTTNFTFDIAALLAGYEYNSYRISWLYENILNIQDTLSNEVENIEAANAEVNDIVYLYNDIIYSHSAYIEWVNNWLNQYSETADYEMLSQISQDIADHALSLQNYVDNIPNNPIEAIAYNLEYLRDYILSTQYELMESFNLNSMLYTDIAQLRENFAAILFTGPSPDTVGLYHTILYNDGNLILPSQLNYDGNEYIVKAIDGNIFAGMSDSYNVLNVKLFLPETVTSISNEAFAIDGIQEVTASCADIPSLDTNCFTNDTYTNANLYVKADLLEYYHNNASWGKFVHILPATTGVNDFICNKSQARIDGGRLTVNAPAGSLISVFTPEGKTIYSGLSGSIDLPARGLYIVKTADQVIKIRY